MAILFIDSFSHYGNGDSTNLFAQKWTTPQTQTARFPGSLVVAGSGRCLQSALQVSRSSDTTVGTGPCVLLPISTGEGVMGVGVKYPSSGIDSQQGYSIFGVKLGGVFAQQTQLECNISSDGTLRAITIDAFLQVVELGRSTVSISAGAWHFVEFVFKIHSTLGAVQIWIDGNTKILDLTNVNTAPQGSNAWTVAQLGQIYSGSGTGSGFLTFSDYYCGDLMTDRKGDCRVFARLPTGDGTYQQFTPNPVGPHYRNVDEVPPNGDTDYNSTSVVGAIDSYTYSPISVPSGNVFAIQVLPMCKKDDVGTRNAATFIRQDGIDYVGVDRSIAAGQYLYQRQMYEKDPTGAAWTVDHANNDEFGVKLTG